MERVLKADIRLSSELDLEEMKKEPQAKSDARSTV
jgi:hypothetical protein